MVTITAETNAILKLDLGDEGGIRRIPLGKLWDPVTSRVSYQRLSNMALDYRDLTDLKVERVTVTYTDEDGDNITISTDDELTDAFEQFATRIPPVVRAKASFQVEKNGKKILREMQQTFSDIGDSVKNGDGPNQMQDVLDSFMTILTEAVDSFSKNMDGLEQKKKGARRIFPPEIRVRNRSHKANCSAIKKRAIKKNLRNKVIEDIFSKAKSDVAHVRARNRNHKACCSEIERRANARNLHKKIIRIEGTDDDSSKTKTDVVHKEDKESKDLNVSREVEKKQNVPSDTTLVVKDSGEGFIHGRHTCDGCGATPIIGVRFHALNLPDYDLCNRCAQKNSKNDIIFEPAELERDRYLQNKWKRQQLRLSDVTRRQCGGEVNSAPFVGMDNALAEAISRSLHDVAPKIKEKKEFKNEETISKREEQSVVGQEQCQIVKEKCSNILTYNDGDDISYSVSTQKSDDSDISDGEQNDDNSTLLCGADDVLGDAIRKGLQDVKSKIGEKEKWNNEITISERGGETQIDNDKEAEALILMDDKDEEKVEAFCKEEEAEDEICVTQSNLTEIESNKYGKEAPETTESKPIERVDEQTLPSLLKPEKKLNTDATTKLFCHDCSSSSSDSQHSDGSGTEDSQGQSDVSLFDKDNDLDASVNANTVMCTNNDIPEESSQSQSSIDSWQILDENEQVSSDEMIAQAAQLLGSALFQSDNISYVTEIKDEHTVTTDHDSISETSLAASVPTIVSRTIPPVVLSRWDIELKELHELGFLDDEKNVDALAHLEAANMGVDSDDPVTVNSAVNYLLAKYSEIL